ncbi:MAG: enoyl-CoA hydratase/isomerase family protein [Actinobacteria bacterium]|nr:enoyl-CoA hydratase/isomerase family protein [Actinomycetota bacterium]
MSNALSIAYDGPVAEVTLTRPDVLNRFDSDLHAGFIEALDDVRHHGGVRAIVLASTGKIFSAGGDFEFMLALHDDTKLRLPSLDEGRRLLNTLIDLPIPIVTALHGDAIGLGATVVLATDAVVAARTAALCDPHVAIGLVAGDGGCVVWPASAGMLRAKRHLLTGDRLMAEDAFAMGLITDLVDTAGEALAAARALAQQIAALPPLAVQGTKRALNRSLQQRAGEVLDLSFALEAISLASDDLVEAIAAFRQKRPANYYGK